MTLKLKTPQFSIPNLSTPLTLPDDILHNIPRYVMDMPSDMTAASLAVLARRRLGADHPAASLKAMNDTLHALMIDEGEREAMLYRQTSVLDALFHGLLSDAICDKVINDGGDAPATPEPSVERPRVHGDILAAALKTQSLCVETVKTIHHMKYLDAIKSQMSNKQEHEYNKLLQSSKNINTPSPHFSAGTD